MIFLRTVCLRIKRRISSLGSLSGKVIVLGLSLLLTGCGSQELYTNLDESEANEMIAVLARQGISAAKEPGEENKFKVTVAKDRFADAVALLSSNGLPHQHFTDMGEAFKKTGLVSSPTEERIRFMHALADSLSETISHIDGVVDAKVHIVLPNNDPFAEKVQPSSASVFIKYRNTADVESFIPQIKQLVVNSIEGLTYDKVSVALFPSTEPVPGREMQAAQTVSTTMIPQRLWLIFGGAALLIFALGGIIATLFRRNAPAASAPAAIGTGQSAPALPANPAATAAK